MRGRIRGLFRAGNSGIGDNVDAAPGTCEPSNAAQRSLVT